MQAAANIIPSDEAVSALRREGKIHSPIPAARAGRCHFQETGKRSAIALTRFIPEPMPFQFQGVHFPMKGHGVKKIESAKFQAPQCPKRDKDAHTEKAECRDEDSGCQVQISRDTKVVSVFLHEYFCMSNAAVASSSAFGGTWTPNIMPSLYFSLPEQL